MPQEVNYLETTCDKIKRILQDWDQEGRFKKYVYGDDSDLEFGSDEMPYVIIDLLDTDVEQGATATDNVTETIKIIIGVNRKEYMDEFDNETFSWKKKVELWVQGNDPITGQYDPGTILGLLRKNFTLGNYALNQKIKIKYGEVP